MTIAHRNILVVDDDATTRMLMLATLRKAGFTVSVAADGQEALSQFRQQRFDLVLLDVSMPDMNGHDVCRAMRAEAGDLLPIVMVTGMDDVQSVETSYHSGATDFIAKPINWPLLGHRVKYALRGYQAMLDLRAAETRNSAILEAIPDLLFEVDLSGRHIDHHSPRQDLLAMPAEQFIGRTVNEVLPPAAARIWMTALHEAHETGTSSGHQYHLDLPGGTFWFELSVSRRATNDGEVPRFIALAREITERRLAETRIRKLAFYDSLTGLPNRQAFMERVDREIGRAQVAGGQLAILFMDLDGFKNVNDTLGHSAGDRILQLAADRLLHCVRPTDMVARTSDAESEIQIARLGGDEFTSLVLNVADPSEAMTVAERILDVMRRPFAIEGRDINLTTSIGIALYPDDGENAGALLKHGDTAMYHAKDSGRDNCQFYSKNLTLVAMRRMELGTDLRLALERGQFTLVYQPQIDLATGTVAAVEALIRWASPDGGNRLPQSFIAAAEENGLIIPIGAWVLRTACADAARWQRSGRSVRVAVNLSPLQFKDPALLEIVFGALALSGLAPELLELEVTEGAVMEYTVATMDTLRSLRERGVRIALDDFGTGYSSLSYLSRMPFTGVKVDRSFVSGLHNGIENRAIVRAILAMAESLGIVVTAEGVETIEQARTLLNMDCELFQGNYFSPPIAREKVPALLASRWTLEGNVRLAPALSASGL